MGAFSDRKKRSEPKSKEGPPRKPESDRVAVFSPDNEPYLGRKSVLHFDHTISACLEANWKAARASRGGDLSPIQRAACQVLPQGINLALCIRELVRQGYLFGAVVLIRPLIERAAIISYLCEKPDEVKVWEAGWPHGKRPSLAKMINAMSGDADVKQAQKLCDTFNHVVHGDPIGATFNLVKTGPGGLGYSVSKALSEPELCDFICYQSYCYLIVLMGRMHQCFPSIGDEGTS